MRALRALAVLLACAGAALPAAGETCTSNASFVWAGVATGSWTGCTPGIDDTFDIASGNVVVVSVDPALTTGAIRVLAGGRLLVGPGITLTYGDGTAAAGAPASMGLNVQEGGVLHTEGALLRTCRITGVVDWSLGVSATHQVRAITDCDLTGVSTSTDYVFFGDEDPDNLDAVLDGRCVHAGPGVGPPGCYRPAYNKWASYQIDAVDAATGLLTWDIDRQATTYTGTPYAGSRYVSSATPMDVSALPFTYTRRWGGRRTLVSIPAAATGLVAIRADRGSWYLQYDEKPADADDPSACSGLVFKILDAVDGGAGADTLEVQGDASGCTHANATAQLTTGARRGDLIHIYRPATLNGNAIVGDVTGDGGIVVNGGHWFARWTRLQQPGTVETSNGTILSPAVFSRNAVVAFLQGASGTEQPSADWDWVDVAYPATLDSSPAGDVAVLQFASSTTGGDDFRYPTVQLSLAGSKFRHVHVHDSLNNTVGGGHHGIYIDSGADIDIAQLRNERLNDDCIGSRYGQSDTTPLLINSFTLRQALNYECIASTANSQQGVEMGVENDGLFLSQNPATSTVQVFQDILSIGHYTSPYVVQIQNSVTKGLTTGAAFDTGAALPVAAFWAGSGAQGVIAAGLGSLDQIPNIVEDSNLYAMHPGTSVTPVAVSGSVSGSFVAGYDTITPTAVSVGNMGIIRRSVIDLNAGTGNAGQATYMLSGGGSAANGWLSPEITNSIVRSTGATANRLANGITLTTGFGFPIINRLGLLIGQPSACANGVLLNFASGASFEDTLTNIDGFLVTANGAATAACIDTTGTNTIINVNRACMESSNGSDSPFAGTGRSATKLTFPNDLVPDSSDALMLRDLLGKPNSDGCLDANLPLELGYNHFRVGHAMLGDGEILGYQRSSSEDLISVSSGGAGGAGSCMGPWPCR